MPRAEREPMVMPNGTDGREVRFTGVRQDEPSDLSDADVSSDEEVYLLGLLRRYALPGSALLGLVAVAYVANVGNPFAVSVGDIDEDVRVMDVAATPGVEVARDLPARCQEVLRTLADGISCGDRLRWLKWNRHMSDEDAADFVGKEYEACAPCRKVPTMPPTPIPTMYDGFRGTYQTLAGEAVDAGRDLGKFVGSVAECEQVCTGMDDCNNFAYCDGTCFFKSTMLEWDANVTGSTDSTCSTFIRTDSGKRQGSPCGLRKQQPPAPELATEYNGIDWPELCYIGKAEEHIFLIGDWGGLPGGAWRHGEPLVADNTKSKNHPRSFYHGTDDHAQGLVASHFNARARKSNPRYVLNVGDNFYWGGIIHHCGEPANKISAQTYKQFVPVFENVYKGPGIDGKPWFGVLGNHDYGGFLFTAGWDQMIAYTWEKSGRWVMPGQYWAQHSKYPDQNFSIDIMMIDNNYLDAKGIDEDPEHNICGRKHNYRDASCGKTGPTSVYDCWGWFRRLWRATVPWLEDHLNRSTADWQIIVSHFPPEYWYDGQRWPGLAYKYGIDLWVAGHRHTQEVHYPSHLGKTAYVVTGGGGGVTSEGLPTHSTPDYGYMDVTINKEELKIEAFGFKWANQWHATTTVVPRRERAPPPSACDRAMDAKTPNGGTCGSRMNWLTHHGWPRMDEQTAKDTIAKEFPEICGACGSPGLFDNGTSIENLTDTAARADDRVMDLYKTDESEKAKCYTDPGSGDGMGDAEDGHKLYASSTFARPTASKFIGKRGSPWSHVGGMR